MEKIAPKIFIYASLLFGVLGILMVLFTPGDDNNPSLFDTILLKSFLITVFVILPSFALSVASKYLNGKR